MRRHPIVSSSAIALALVATACGPGSHTRSLDTGIAEDRPVRDLSMDEVTQICEATADYFEAAQGDADLRHATCLFQVLASHATSTPETCEAAVTRCEEDSGPGPDIDCSGVTTLPECDALVGEFEVCATDQVNAFRGAADGLDCTLVTSPDLDAMIEERTPTALPESCAAIAEDTGCRTEESAG